MMPQGQLPPLFTITSSDQGGTIAIVTGQCLVIAIVAGLIRAFVLLEIGGARLRWDDIAIGVSILFTIVQTSLVQKEARLGLGRTIHDVIDTNILSIQSYQFADQLFYILAVWMSKLSVVLFVIRLSPRKTDHLLAHAVTALIATSGVSALLITIFACDISRPWQYFTSTQITCTTPYSRWIAVASLSIVTEILLAFLALYIIWSLKMGVSKKIIVASAFLQRLFIVVPIITRLHYLHKVYFSSDATLNATTSTICKEVEIAFGIVAACIPCLRPFLTATATYYGGPAEGVKSYTGRYGSSSNSNAPRSRRTGEGISLKRLTTSRNQHSATAKGGNSTQSSHFDVRDVDGSSANNRRGPHDNASVRSDDSRNLIIRKDTDYQVQYFEHESGSYPDGPSRSQL